MSKQPFVTKAMIEKIVKTYPTPFHIYSEEGICSTVKSVYDAFDWNHGFTEYFAVKALPNPFILNILHEYGCGVDCSSLTELQMAAACGFKGREIMFSSNDTPLQEFAYAHQLGAIINLDDITHIDTLREALGGILPKYISCRFNPGGVFKLSNGIMDNPGEAKYGMTEDQIFEAFKDLQKAGVKEFGLHTFLASNTLGEDYYAEIARILFNLSVKLHQELGCKIGFINLSGGVGIPYKPDQAPNNICLIGEKVQEAYEEIMVPAGLDKVNICTEMGRFITGPHGHLVTKVINRKDTHKHYIGTDSSVTDLIRPAMYGAYHHITVLGKESWELDHIYDVTGPLCENNDKFAVNRELPRIEIGDYLVIHDTGAHGRAMGYNYNERLRCGEILLHPDGSFTEIRRRETPRDYFATLDVCPEIRDMYIHPQSYPGF